jgi:hypothetical protein
VALRSRRLSVWLLHANSPCAAMTPSKIMPSHNVACDNVVGFWPREKNA